jgi:hypothetical protein
MAHDPPRWRFRIRTLMLLVIIVALALTLVIERRNRERDVPITRAEAEVARLQAQRAEFEAPQNLENAMQAKAQFDAILRSQLPQTKSPDRTIEKAGR